MMYSYELVEKNKSSQYGDYILPQVLQELLIDEDLICLGVKEKESETPVGALVAELEMDGNIELLSLFVDTAHRKQGIGSGLLDLLLRIASESFLPVLPQQKEAYIQLKTDYILKEPYLTEWEEFLKGNGFCNFANMEGIIGYFSEKLKCYQATRKAFSPTYRCKAEIKSFQRLPETVKCQLSDNQEKEQEQALDLELSLGYLENGELVAALFVEKGYGSSAIVQKLVIKKTQPLSVMQGLFNELLHLLFEKYGEFYVFVPECDGRLRELLESGEGGAFEYYEEHRAWVEVLLDLNCKERYTLTEHIL